MTTWRTWMPVAALGTTLLGLGGCSSPADAIDETYESVPGSEGLAPADHPTGGIAHRELEPNEDGARHPEPRDSAKEPSTEPTRCPYLEALAAQCPAMGGERQSGEIDARPPIDEGAASEDPAARTQGGSTGCPYLDSRSHADAVRAALESARPAAGGTLL